MFSRYAFLTILLAILLQSSMVIAAIDTLRIHTDLPFINKEKKIFLDVYYTSDSLFIGSLQIQFYKYNNDGDSILVLNKRNSKFVFKRGINRTRINFSETDSNTFYARKFYEVLKRTDGIAPGDYKVFLTVKRGDKNYRTTYLHDIDSMLTPRSPVRQDINASLAPKSKSFLGLRLKKAADHAKSSDAGTALLKAKNKVDKAAKKRGLTSVHRLENNKSYVDLFYDDWFAGSYEVKNNESLSKHLQGEENAKDNPGTSSSLDHPSLFWQYKEINKSKKDQDEIKVQWLPETAHFLNVCHAAR